MLAFLFNFLIFAAESGADPSSNWGKFLHFWNTYANYPGFEAWRFFNLAVFVLIMYYILKKPLTEAFKSKRELIRAELIKAEEEKKAAQEELTKAEAHLAGIDAETEDVIKKANLDAVREKARILEQAEDEVNRLRLQAESEITRSGKLAQLELRRFSAEESIRLAEEKIKASMNEQKDAELVKSGIKAIGGLN